MGERTSQFFAELFRPARVSRSCNGGIALNFFDRRQRLLECAIVSVLALVCSLPFIALALVLWIFVFLLMVVAYIGLMVLQMRRTANLGFFVDERNSVVLRKNGKDQRIENVVRVIYEELSGFEDLERPESGSTRIYLEYVRGTKNEILPLFISSVSLKGMGKQIAGSIGVPFSVIKRSEVR